MIYKQIKDSNTLEQWLASADSFAERALIWKGFAEPVSKQSFKWLFAVTKFHWSPKGFPQEPLVCSSPILWCQAACKSHWNDGWLVTAWPWLWHSLAAATCGHCHSTTLLVEPEEIWQHCRWDLHGEIVIQESTWSGRGDGKFFNPAP